MQIFNSFELLYTVTDGITKIDNEYLEQKSVQCKSVGIVPAKRSTVDRILRYLMETQIRLMDRIK